MQGTGTFVVLIFRVPSVAACVDGHGEMSYSAKVILY